MAITCSMENVRTDEVKEALNGAIEKALEMIGMQAESYAKLLCPVDTGNLRNSISHGQVDETSEAIGSNVEYAAFVEMGHHSPSGAKFIPAQPYLAPAIENHLAEYEEMVKDCLQNA